MWVNQREKWEMPFHRKWKYFHAFHILFVFLALASHTCPHRMPERIQNKNDRCHFTHCHTNTRHIDKPFGVNWSRRGNVTVRFSVCTTRTSTACRTFIAHDFRFISVYLCFAFNLSCVFFRLFSFTGHERECTSTCCIDVALSQDRVGFIGACEWYINHVRRFSIYYAAHTRTHFEFL